MTQLQTVLLTNDNGMSVEVINFGARVSSIKFPIKGIATEMLLGYAATKEYLSDDFYLGATCGRVCNRIAKGEFTLAGRQYQLAANDGENCLHGGEDNFSMRYWQIDTESLTDTAVTLYLVSNNGDQGFPGRLNVSVSYQLSADNKLSIQYSGTTDIATPINLTNHAYFHLGEQDCLSLELTMQASSYLETDAGNIPTGNLVPTEGTDFSFTQAAGLGSRQQNSQDKSLQAKQGYDHCFVLDDTPLDQAKAVLTSLKNQVSLSVYTDQPAIQLYTGFYLAAPFQSYQGVCLEAQNYPNAINVKHFPNGVLMPHEHYSRQIVYAFSASN